MIRIESRNVDGHRVIHKFCSVEDMISDWNSDDTTMGDNHILLVVYDNMVVFSSMGRTEATYDDTVRTANVIDWFSEI